MLTLVGARFDPWLQFTSTEDDVEHGSEETDTDGDAKYNIPLGFRL